jgi:glycerophosphoryl diester phosphodiesterase
MKSIPFVIVLLVFLSPVSAQQNAIFVAHRGASYLAPENTKASIELAWELGAAAAECDIMLTKDKQVILFHDKKGKRLTGSDFVVKDVNYDEISDLPIKLRDTNLPEYQGETIPLLKEILATLPGDRTLVIEIKTGPEILPHMKEVIDANWKSGNIAFIAFDFETILATKELYPEIPCYYLSAFKADVSKKRDEIINSKLDGINLRHKIIDEALVKDFNEHGKGVWCWTVNEPADAKRMMAAGVTAITTDRPKWLKEQTGQ